ncbi:DnaD domain protein [Qiania dongpingensis]|uniref:DnaD domain protein n=1 Tax=Qiania dongpingensis TaxID=2763669 RepID=A0A7G9G0K9_9FIRM|nr:DnaD domain protein [Qiania dongpingensis]QNM04341.1 DnaD domain protein [Qiania dongpingensis]
MREVRSMAGLFVTNRQKHGVTVVSNQFIDRFLPEASGEFVKVYLLLLRRVSEGGELSISHMADGLDNTEKDVLRALKYWERMNLLKLEYGEDKKLQGIVLLEEDCAESAVTAEEAVTAGKKTEAARESERKPADLQALQTDEEFCQLLYLAGRYTAKTLTPRDCDVLANLYGSVGMSAELLEYLIEYCVSGGHKSMRYIETVALNWHERGIRTVEQAKGEAVMGGRNTYAVLKAFGLGGRNPAAGERAMIDQWFRDYGFPVEVVVEACDRTMRAIHQPSFEYADRILRDWKEKGIRERDDIARLDEKPAAKSGGSRKAAGKKEDLKKSNKFHNFTERDYDCDELMKKINGLM